MENPLPPEVTNPILFRTSPGSFRVVRGSVLIAL
jgi:hypothetical protein